MKAPPRCPKCGERFVTRALRDKHHAGCTSTKYELVICDHHGGTVLEDDTSLGYVICVHVKDQEVPVAQTIPAKDSELGEIVCGECAKGNLDGLKELSLICSICARQRGFLAAA